MRHLCLRIEIRMKPTILFIQSPRAVQKAVFGLFIYSKVNFSMKDIKSDILEQGIEEIYGSNFG